MTVYGAPASRVVRRNLAIQRRRFRCATRRAPRLILACADGEAPRLEEARRRVEVGAKGVE